MADQAPPARRVRHVCFSTGAGGHAGAGAYEPHARGGALLGGAVGAQRRAGRRVGAPGHGALAAQALERACGRRGVVSIEHGALRWPGMPAAPGSASVARRTARTPRCPMTQACCVYVCLRCTPRRFADALTQRPGEHTSYFGVKA